MAINIIFKILEFNISFDFKLVPNHQAGILP